VFVTEATFGTPAYVWDKGADLGKEIFDWWIENSEKGLNSVLFAYSLGKAQRVLGVLAPFATKPVYCHPTATVLSHCYRSQGISLAPTRCLSQLDSDRILRGELLLVPQSFLKESKAEILGGRYKTAFASGWMANDYHSYDRGFLMSDHADWNDLLRTVQETKAHTVYVQHRGKGALVKHLRSLGLKAYPDTDLVPANPDQMSLF
jgi:putative mRNA 3-end processing factor